MAHPPFLLFDKSALESLNLDEADLLDNFYQCVITPIFFVECMADLSRALTLKNKGTQETIVASLAKRTPDHNYRLSMHHIDLLVESEFANKLLPRFRNGPFPPRRKQVKLDNQRGLIYKTTPEQEAMIRWTQLRFLDVERSYARAWREQLSSINLSDRVKQLHACIGSRWRKPGSLDDARRMTDVIIDFIDATKLLEYSLDLFGFAAQKESIITAWVRNKRPPLRQCCPYLVYLASINIFFALVLPTQLLKNVKESHVVDLAYLYYLPFCSIFTSKDDFHVKIVPLFLSPDQSFVNGADLKADLKKLDDHYSELHPAEIATGMTQFARVPPDNTDFLTTRLWDKHTPKWRDEAQPVHLNQQLQTALKELVDRISLSTKDPSTVVSDIREIDFLSIENQIYLRKGKYPRYSAEKEERIIASEK